MKDPRAYLAEVQQNVEKMRAQAHVTPADNALFGMLDGVAGLLLLANERIAHLEQRVAALEKTNGSS